MTKEEMKEYARNYYETHKEESRKYRETHKEERKEYMKTWHKTHNEQSKESKRKYYKAHKKECDKKQLARYYKMKNEFHDLNISLCFYNYYVRSKMYRYFSSLENYVSFSLNPDAKLKLRLVAYMRSGKISEQDAMDTAAIPLTEGDLEYIHSYYMKTKYSKERQ